MGGSVVGGVALLLLLSDFSHLLEQGAGNPLANTISAGLLEIVYWSWTMMGSIPGSLNS